MSEMLNGEGRVFGCLSAAEQQELRDAAKVPGAVVAVWLDGGWATDSNPFVGDAFAYRVTMPAAPVCPVCGLELIENRDAARPYVCKAFFTGCNWTQPDAVQRPKRPDRPYHIVDANKMVAPAPEPVPVNLCDTCARNMRGCIPSPAPHYACGFYAAAKSPAKVIEPLGNFPDMALMREKVNELVAWVNAKGG